MRKIRRTLSLCLALVLCLGMATIAVSAAPMYEDGYISIRDGEGNWFGGYYDVNTTFEYHLQLMVYDEDVEDYVEQPIKPESVVKIYLNDAQSDEDISLLASGTGSVISWTATQPGDVYLRVELSQDGYVYENYENYWIGKPVDIEYAAHVEYLGLTGDEGILYTGKSIKNDFVVVDYFSGELLQKGVDYRLTVTNAKNPGDGVVTVEGLGDYCGTMQEAYTIVDHTKPFGDIKRNGWYVGAINFALDQGLFAGTGPKTFTPDGAMTRGMFVTVIGRMLGWDTLPNVNSVFVDVPRGQYYTKFVAYAHATGIVGGVSATEFAPNARITREQMCAILLRVNTFVEKSYEQGSGEQIDLSMSPAGAKFSDHNKISKYAREAVYCCRNAGIVSGRPGNLFDPKGDATRAEVATILLGYYRYLGLRLIEQM
ncbi:MAG: S-layer homology domain-containing protein [Clostridia bacterium]|nr:S-layer homology domain-containing protein [Clostridia bacterium]